MGHRANYAIREQGLVELFYSSWGASTVPRDLFWGPDSAEAFIRNHSPVDGDDWLDDVVGEGGAAFDKDQQTVVLFGGEKVGYPPLRDVFVRLMNGLWARWGWTVEWAAWGMPDLAAQVGRDAEAATSGPMPSMIPEPTDLAGVFERRGMPKAFVTVVDGGGCEDRVSDFAASDLVAIGPELLGRIDELPHLREARGRCEAPSFADPTDWSLGRFFSSCLLVDRDRRRLQYTGYLRYGEKIFNEMRWQESDWEIEYLGNHLQDLRLHFEATGRAVPPELQHSRTEVMSEDACLDAIAKELFADEHSGPTAAARQLLKEVRAPEAAFKVDPRALETPPDGRPSPEICRERFGWALASMVNDFEQAFQ